MNEIDQTFYGHMHVYAKYIVVFSVLKIIIKSKINLSEPEAYFFKRTFKSEGRN